jgi:hypothetical protein
MAEIKRPVQVTLGPWNYRPSDHDDWGWVRDPDGRIVANARYDHDYPEEALALFRASKLDPCESNGRLIAAAPELYHALRACCDALVSNFIEMGASDDGISNNPAIKAARAALAKAEGVAP